MKKGKVIIGVLFAIVLGLQIYLISAINTVHSNLYGFNASTASWIDAIKSSLYSVENRLEEYIIDLST